MFTARLACVLPSTHPKSSCANGKKYVRFGSNSDKLCRVSKHHREKNKRPDHKRCEYRMLIFGPQSVRIRSKQCTSRKPRAVLILSADVQLITAQENPRKNQVRKPCTNRRMCHLVPSTHCAELTTCFFSFFSQACPQTDIFCAQSAGESLFARINGRRSVSAISSNRLVQITTSCEVTSLAAGRTVD